MAIKRSFTQRSLPNHSTQKQLWYQTLLLLALVPLLVGILLILTALTGVVVWYTPWEQVVIGGLYIVVSFVFSNLLQKHWKLAVGWLLLGAAVWLGMSWPAVEVKVAAAALAGLSIAVLSREFLRKRQQYLANRNGKKSASRGTRRK